MSYVYRYNINSEYRCAFKSNFAIYIRKNTLFWSAVVKIFDRAPFCEN
jgi:hypothetical protein